MGALGLLGREGYLDHFLPLDRAAFTKFRNAREGWLSLVPQGRNILSDFRLRVSMNKDSGCWDSFLRFYAAWRFQGCS